MREEQEEIDKVESTESEGIRSDFSASFYGPLYTEEEEVREFDGYILVKDTHPLEWNKSMKNHEENAENKIRYYLLTK